MWLPWISSTLNSDTAAAGAQSTRWRVREQYLGGNLWPDAALLVRVQRAWNGAIRERTPCGNGSFMANTANIRAALVWSNLSRLNGAIGVSLYCATALAVLSLFAASLAVAEQRYEPAVSIEREVDTFIVNPDGSYRETLEYTERIETPKAVISEGAQYVGYPSSRETIESLEAWIIQPDGTKIVVPPESIRTQEEDTSGGSTEFSDYKYKVIIYPQVQVGSRLYWKTVSTVRPLFEGQFFQTYGLSRTVRMDHWEVDIALPIGKPLYIEQRGVAGGLVGKSADKDHYRFVYQHLTALPPEEVGVSTFDYGDVLRVSTLPDALALGKLYQGSAASKSAVTERIRALAFKLTSGFTGERERAKALYIWVSNNVRYVAVTLGNGGYAPHSADQVLSNAYGDCKDHVVLLEALLAAVGIDSTPALINSGSAYTLAQVGVFSPLNHAITYLPTLDLYVDSTAQFAPFGVLPFEETDKLAVLTSLGRIGRTPPLRADANFTHTKVSIVIHPDGSIEGNSKATMGGDYEIDSRAVRFGARGDPEDQVAKRSLSRFGETGSGSISNAVPEDIDTPYWIEGRFQLDPVANIPGRGAMQIPVGLAPGSFAGFGGRRPTLSQQQPLWPCRSQTISESYTLQFPMNVLITSIPEDASYQDDQIDFHATYRRDGQKVFVERMLVVQRPSQVCNAGDLENWRAFLVKVQRDLRSQIFYR